VFPKSDEPGSGLVFFALAAAFAASGVAALIDQTVWQRMLGIFAGSDAVTAAIVVGAFLLGLGLGSLAAGLFADRLGPARAACGFAACEVGIGLFGLLSKPFLYDFVALRLGPWVDDRLAIFLVCFAGLLLPTFLMGCSLPLLARAAVTGIAGAARRIGLLYGLNTAGAGLGALFGGWWLIGTVGFETALWVAAGAPEMTGSQYST
jgi:predicted membrane-bound spermidine synthase